MFENVPIDTADLPRYEEVALTPLDPRAAWVPMFRSFVILSIVMAALNIAPQFDPEGELAALGPWPSYALIPFFALWPMLIRIAFRYKGYALRTHDIFYRSGVIRRETTILPLNRIQHVETHRGAIDRRLGLSTLRLYTAGGSAADLVIRGLNFESADQIRDFVLQSIKAESLRRQSEAD